MMRIGAGPLEDRFVRLEPFEDGLKAEGGRLTLILARAVGDVFTDKDVDVDAVRAFLIEEGAAA